MGSLCWGLHLHTALLLLINTDPCTAAATHSTVNLTVSMGQEVHLFCNDSNSDFTQISWRKNHTVIFTYSTKNQTPNNCPLDRVCVDEPRDLRISSVQMSDEGIYSCTVTTDRGTYVKEWRISVNDTNDAAQIKINIVYFVAPAASIITAIIGIWGAVLCHRLMKKNRNKTDKSNENTGGTDTGRRRAQRVTGHQYTERTNSAYGT
nr:uncharacterized protein LOC111834066 [Paramormyrops kingsleyae]